MMGMGGGDALQPFVPFAGVSGDPMAGMLNGVNTSLAAMADFAKALTAGYGTDVVGLTGGGALRIQSLEATLLATIPRDIHFRLFNKLTAANAGATVDEYSIKSAIGGYPGSGFNSELGIIAETQGTYARRAQFVKFLMTMRQISAVQLQQKTLVDSMAIEKIDGARELKRSCEWGFFYGNSAVNPLEFDGIPVQIASANDSDLVIDARGQSVSFIAQELIKLSAVIAGDGRFGQATDYFCSYLAQQDLDQKLDPGVRVPITDVPDGGIRLGSKVVGIRTSFGDIASNPDVFLQEGGMPWDVKPGNPSWAALVTAAGLTAPATVTGTPAAGTVANRFDATWAGKFYYGVESVGKTGRSTCTVSAQVTIAAGQKVTITIANPADANVTGYWIHRSRKNGSNAKNDLREMVRIPRTDDLSGGQGNTLYVDENLDLPGTAPIFILNMAPGDMAITLRRLMPMMMFPLYPTNSAAHRWAQLLFLYLRVGKPNNHGYVKNVLPIGATWNPAG